MGNQLAQPARLQADHLAELSDVVLKDTLGGGRFLKTVLCVHDDGGLVVVKVYYKRGEGADLRSYEQQLVDIRNRLAGLPCSHVWPWQGFWQTEKAAYLIRQYVHANLHTRLSTRPFLSDIEKRWIAFQLLHGLAAAHGRGVAHGDIKAENVLVTSWAWAFLADFAPYKPTFLPADNPADFSFFFDTGGRRRCYVAPERFYEGGPAAAPASAPLAPSMDIFSLGCVLAELFLDGQALFDLSQLLAYRREEYDPLPSLEKLDPALQELILHMIQRQPERRLGAAQYLERWGLRLFPPTFATVLHPFFDALTYLDSDARIAKVQAAFPHLCQVLQSGLAKPAPSTNGTATRPAMPLPPTAQPASAAGARPTFEASSATGTAAPATHPRAAAAVGSAARPGPPPAPAPQHADVAALEDPTAPAGEGLADVTRLLADTQDLLGRLRAGPPARTPSAALDDSPFILADDAGPSPNGSKSRPAQASAVSSAARSQQPASQALPVQPAGSPSEDPPAPSAAPPQPPAVSTGAAAAVVAAAPPEAPGPVANGRDGMMRSANCMTLLAGLLCTLVRGAKLQEFKAWAVGLLAEADKLCDDDTRLQRVIPYLLAAVTEPLAAVRCAALRCLARVASRMHALPPSEARIFLEYILPSLSMVPTDAEESVRCEFVACSIALAAAAQRFLLRPPPSTHADGAAAPVARPDRELADLRATVWAALHEAAAGSQSTPATRCALLAHTPSLAAFLGRREANDLLLPTLVTFLNVRDQWQLRAAFFRHLAALAPHAGAAGLDALLLPCVEQALGDGEDAVVAAALGFLTQASSWLRRRSLLGAVAKASPKLLLHHSTAVRTAAVEFVAAAAAALAPADVCAHLLPLVQPALTQEPTSLTSQAAILAALGPPLQPPPAPPQRAQAASATARPQSANTAGRLFQPAGVPGGGGGGLAAANAWRSQHVSGNFSRAHGLGGSAGLRRDGIGQHLNQHAQQQALGSLRSGAAAPRPGARPRDAASQAPGSGSDGTVLTPVAALYSLPLPDKYVRPSVSMLAAALEAQATGSTNGSQGGTGPQNDRGTRGGQGANGSAAAVAVPTQPPWTSATTQHSLPQTARRLVAGARRVAAGGDLGGALPASTNLAPTLALAPALLLGHEDESLSLGGLSPPSADVSDAVAAALATGLPAHPASSGATQGPSAALWHPRGVLVAHLAEHRRAVVRLAVADNGAFFASASADETVKVWDCRRLEKDVNFRSKLTYGGHGARLTALAACQDSASMASAAVNGGLHVWRVEYTTRAGGAPDRYTGIVGVRQLTPSEGAILEVNAWGPDMLVYATQRGGLHGWDLRAPRDAWTLATPPQQGVHERLTGAPRGGGSNGGGGGGGVWLASGSNRGYLTIWDLRFLIPVQTWQHPARCPIEALAVAVAPAARLGLRGRALSCPLLYVAAGPAEVSLWDVEEARCHQVLRVPALPAASPSAPGQVDVPAALARQAAPPAVTSAGGATDPAALANHLAVADLQVPPPRLPGVRALLPTGAGPILTGGTDAAIRLWDAAQPDQSYTVCAPPPLSEGGVPQAAKPAYYHRNIMGVSVVEEVTQRSAAAASLPDADPALDQDRSLAVAHADALLHLAAVNSHGSRLLLSACQDGIVKVWR